MIIISSVTDIRTYVANANPGGVLGDDTLVDGLVEAIRAADDRPAWGQDWEEWLDANTGRLARDVYESTIHVGDWVVADGRPEDRLSEEIVEALTLIAEAAGRRGIDAELPPGDVWSWSAILSEAGATDLADRVTAIRVNYEVQS